MPNRFPRPRKADRPKLFQSRLFAAGALALAAQVTCAFAQRSIQTLVINRIDEAQAVTLAGNIPPLARPEFDQGLVPSQTRISRMVLMLKPNPARQAALDTLLSAQQDPVSPLYHRWLTPAEFGARFGASDAELAQIAAWLAGQGFSVEEISAGRRLVIFSGNAGQVFDAFHTEIHRYRTANAQHLANAQDPQVPAALANSVEGILSLHDFRRTPQGRIRSALTPRPQYTAGATHYVFPADFVAIYDLKPLYDFGTNGESAAIAIAARSNIDPADVAQFRALAGLAANQPEVLLAGGDPGLVPGDQHESTMAVEWSGAVAPAAPIRLVVAPSSSATDGIDLAAAYIVNHQVAPIVAVSYGSCEHQMGAAELAFYNSLWQQAAAQGMSVFVASGDAGAAGCSAGSDSSGSMAAVNGLCSSPYSTCVGGTQFADGASASQLWGSSNTAGYGSALGYIPEEVWNESAVNGGTGLWASGGGISSVYAQPLWQAETEGAAQANGMRGVPDVALAAADHAGAMMVENGSVQIVSGTSVAAPAFAGILALVVQQNGPQGNANPQLYALARTSPDAFHATIHGNNSVPGVEGFSASGATYNLATGLGSVDGAVLVNSWERASNKTGPDFSLVPSAQAGSVALGSSTTFTIGVTESGAAKNAVTLSAAAPAGVSVSFSPAQIVPGSPALVTVAAGTAAVAGDGIITFTASDASGAQSFDYTLTIVPRMVFCSTQLVRMHCSPVLPRRLFPLGMPALNPALQTPVQ